MPSPTYLYRYNKTFTLICIHSQIIEYTINDANIVAVCNIHYEIFNSDSISGLKLDINNSAFCHSPKLQFLEVRHEIRKGAYK